MFSAIRRSLFFGLILVFGGAANIGQARDLFVDNVLGDDRNNGGTPITAGAGNGPFRSITRALVAARKHDRLILAPGEPYYECITLQGGQHSGLEGYPFEIIGNGAVLNGTQPVPERDWEHVSGSLFRVRPERMSYQTLFLDDKPAARAATGTPPDQLTPLQWVLNDGHIYFRTEDSHLPYEYAPRYGTRHVGLTLYDVSHVRINGLKIRGYHLDGLNAHDNALQVVLEEVTADYNGRSGFSIGGSSRVQMFGCRGSHNGRAQVRMEQFCHVDIFDGDFDSVSAPQLDREGGKLTVSP